MTGAAKDPVLKLLADAGKACSDYQDKALRNLSCRLIQADEIWSFCYAKAKNLPQAKRGDWGYVDVWTWTALCSDCKLVPSWVVGSRNGDVAARFMLDLQKRLANRIQLTTDGHKAYLNAVEEAFGADIDYAICIKVYWVNPEVETSYSPAECLGTELIRIQFARGGTWPPTRQRVPPPSYPLPAPPQVPA